MEEINHYKRRRNIMSYMVTIKGKYGTVIASDSYSCYYTRKLKNPNYKKIHEIIPNQFYIGLTGLNVLYDEKDTYIDTEKVIKHIFNDVNRKTLENKIELFANTMQEACDNFGADASCVYIYKNEMFVTDIIHQLGHNTNYWGPHEFDIIFMGEDYHKSKAKSSFSFSDMFQSLDNNIQKCKQSVQNQIQYENTLFPDGQRVVGGDIQIASVKHQ